MKKFISASLLSANLLRLEEEVKLLEKAGVDFLHIDVMDGVFVPNITFGPWLVKALRKITALPLDVHLMIERPENYINDFISAGADLITIHPQTCRHLHRTLEQIKSLGGKAGIALLPTDWPNSIRYALDILDMVLVMSVNPGFGGQKFIDNQLAKINILSNMLNKDTLLGVDGGINQHTASLASQAGANVFVSGSYLYESSNVPAQLEKLRSAIK